MDESLQSAADSSHRCGLLLAALIDPWVEICKFMKAHGDVKWSLRAALGSDSLLLCLERGLDSSFCTSGSISQFTSCL